MARSDPLNDLLHLQERMNRLLEESLSADSSPGPGAATWAPAADVQETAEGFVLEVELPGVAEEDVEVVFAGDEVRVRGSRSMPTESGTPERFQRLERRYGGFARSFHLGAPVDGARATRVLSAGVLRIDVPRAPSRP